MSLQYNNPCSRFFPYNLWGTLFLFKLSMYLSLNFLWFSSHNRWISLSLPTFNVSQPLSSPFFMIHSRLGIRTVIWQEMMRSFAYPTATRALLYLCDSATAGQVTRLICMILSRNWNGTENINVLNVLVNRCYSHQTPQSCCLLRGWICFFTRSGIHIFLSFLFMSTFVCALDKIAW
jgi:hypothetical protein